MLKVARGWCQCNEVSRLAQSRRFLLAGPYVTLFVHFICADPHDNNSDSTATPQMPNTSIRKRNAGTSGWEGKTLTIMQPLLMQPRGPETDTNQCLLQRLLGGQKTAGSLLAEQLAKSASSLQTRLCVYLRYLQAGISYVRSVTPDALRLLVLVHTHHIYKYLLLHIHHRPIDHHLYFSYYYE